MLWLRVRLPAPHPGPLATSVSVVQHKGGSRTPSTWDFPAAEVITNAQSIFNALAPVAAVAVGITLGPRLLRSIARMFR